MTNIEYEGPKGNGSSKITPVVMTIVALVAIAAGTVFGASKLMGSTSTEGAAPLAPTTEVFLEPAQSIGTDAFFAQTDELVDVVPLFLGARQRKPVNVSAAKTDNITSFSGSEPGLYGGTRDNGSCDRERLVQFLKATPDKAAAWARVQGIDPADIGAFVDTLTPVVLLRDTRVTNHGFREGNANAIQSVLQAGTAVLVDDRGLPRARCACGNPLIAPIAQAAPVYSDQGWVDFSPDELQVISAGAASSQLVLQDLAGGVPFARSAGSGGTQDFAATAAVIAAIRPEIVVKSLGDPTVGAPVGGVVVLGTAAAGLDAGYTPTTPLSSVPDTVLVNVYTPGVGEVIGVAPAVRAEEAATAPTAPTARAVTPVQPTSAPRPTPTSGPAPTPARPTQTPTVAPPPPAATAAPAPAATAVPPPPPTATPLPTVVPTPTSPPLEKRIITGQGSVSANSTFTGFPATFAVDGSTSSSWFSVGPGVGPAVFTWTGPRTEITDVGFVGNASHNDPQFRTGFGFASVTIEILDGGSVVYTATGGGFGWTWAPEVVGNQVRLTFTGHESPDCGGFSELVIRGLQ